MGAAAGAGVVLHCAALCCAVDGWLDPAACSKLLQWPPAGMHASQMDARSAPFSLGLHPPPCRFSATDSRCEMELDEVDPSRWAALEAATEEYIGLAPTQGQFAAAAAALVEGLS